MAPGLSWALDWIASRYQLHKSSARNPSLPELKPLEPVQLLLNAALQPLARAPRRAGAEPAPFLQQQFLVLAVGFQIERGDDVDPRQHRQREIPKTALFLRHVGLEAVFVVEEEMGALALDDQRVERGEDVHQLGSRAHRIFQRPGPGPRPPLP